MDAAGGPRAGHGRGEPRLLEHCAAFERLVGTEEVSARARLDNLLGGELAGLLCRALTRRPHRSPFAF
jgi:hypothetical protein